MFEWLDVEIKSIRTPKFFLVDGPASAQLREAVKASDFPLPPSYREFVLRFGNAKLYRSGSIWRVQVHAGPREVEGSRGESLIHFGRSETALAYFKTSLLKAGEESPVFEWRHNQGVRQAADGFEEWLKTKCRLARKQYKGKEWKAIEEGPAPFTVQEQAIVEARKKFQWRIVGVAPNEDLRFEIHNGSAITLPFLSIGVRGQLRQPGNGSLDGGAFLPVSSIAPGETRIIEKDCYKDLLAPQNAEVFALPDPGPEDRDQYWEFHL